MGPGCFRLAELVPEGLEESDFYSSYYRRFNFIDEIGYLLPLDGESTLHVSMGRASSRSPFARSELRLLVDATPVVRAVGARLRTSLRDGATADTAIDENASLRFDEALEAFTASSLTAREREIVGLQLRGHSVKAIAGRLDIAPGTVRNHIKNVHLKLEITSQRELFSMFIDQALSPAT